MEFAARGHLTEDKFAALVAKTLPPPILLRILICREQQESILLISSIKLREKGQSDGVADSGHVDKDPYSDYETLENTGYPIAGLENFKLKVRFAKDRHNCFAHPVILVCLQDTNKLGTVEGKLIQREHRELLFKRRLCRSRLHHS